MFNRFDVPMSPMERNLKQKQEIQRYIRDNEEFKRSITAICENYIKMIDLKIHNQDLKIENAFNEVASKVIEEFATEIESVVSAKVVEIINSGNLTVNTKYNEETENLELIIGGVNNG